MPSGNDALHFDTVSFLSDYGLDDEFAGRQQVAQGTVGEDHFRRDPQLRASCTRSRTPTPTPPRGM